MPFHRSGEGPPLVLLHGLTGTWRVWRPLIPALETDFDVFAPTLPGHHRSDALPDGWELSATGIADLLEQQFDRVGIERAHLVGNSLGGWMALELARRGRALSVTALSPAGAWASQRDLHNLLRGFALANLAMSRLGGYLTGPQGQRLARRPRFRKVMLKSVAEHGERVPAQDLPLLLEDAIGCVVLSDFLAWAKEADTFAPFDVPEDLLVRIAWSEKDRTIPFKRFGRPMVDQVRGAELVTLPGVGHVPMFDDPDLVLRTIRDTVRAAGDRAAATTQM